MFGNVYSILTSQTAASNKCRLECGSASLTLTTFDQGVLTTTEYNLTNIEANAQISCYFCTVELTWLDNYCTIV